MSYGLPHLNFRDLSSASALQARRDRERERRAPTTDQIIDARQKKHVEDAFISSQLVELGLLNPKHAVGKGAGRAFKSESREEIVKGTGKAEAYPKKNSSITQGTAFTPRSDQRAGSVKSHKSKSSINELKNRAGGGERGMLDSERTRTRRERTFVGSECAVCEEPLEHTLRGERILQFSCGHVCHGACFYEYMKEFDSHYCPTCNAPLGLDTSRGGNVLDIEKISDMVRTASVQDRTTAATPTPSNWDNQTIRPPSSDSQGRHYEQDRSQSRHGGREIAAGYRDPRRDTHQTNNTHNTQNTRMTRESHNTQISHGTHRTQDSHDIYAQNRSHKRMDSEATGHNSNGYQETVLSGPRRAHDYDLQQMETSLPSPRHSQSKNPVPPPVVSVRSEFPTINRAKIQQTLTCLVTIEVPDNKWRPDPEDLRPPPVPAIPEDDVYERPPSPAKSIPRFYPYESPEVLAEMTENLRGRVENWHGLDFSRFGKLRLYGTIRVGKDKIQWQELECYLFAEMLICVKEKKGAPLQQWADEGNGRRNTRCTLKGSILIKKHLNGVTQTSASEQIGMTQKITSSNLRAGEENILTLSLSVAELPQFHLQFENLNQLKLWKQALLDINAVEISPDRHGDYERDYDDVEDDDYRRSHGTTKRGSSLNSSVYGAGRTAMSTATAPTEYTNHRSLTLNASPHVPIDIVVVIPISSSMQGVKMSLVRDALNYLVHNLGARDRMGLVTFGSSGGGVPLVGMTGKAWSGWGNIFQQIRPVGQKLHRADVVEGANTAMDLLMQRKSCNPISTILLISDASGSDGESVDFVVSRAEAAKIAIHSFGLGLTHTPTSMLELSTRTKGLYTYVKDWMQLRECLAGCLGSLQSISHASVKLKLRLPEGSPAKFVKISGALAITKRATGRDAEAQLGDLRFGDKRDVLVQLVITPDLSGSDQGTGGQGGDAWDNIMSNLEALAGPLENESPRPMSVEEVPLIQADVSWGDILRDNTTVHLPRPSLLAITMLPAATSNSHQVGGLGRKTSFSNASPPIPPHPSIVQRRMELLTSDMLSRALTLVSRGQHERAAHLLTETRTILKGLGKGGLPPLPPLPQTPHTPNLNLGLNRLNYPGGGNAHNGNQTPHDADHSPTHSAFSFSAPLPPPPGPPPAPPSPLSLSQQPSHSSLHTPHTINTGAGIDPLTVAALDAELEAALEWIHHPAVFARDSRKAVLQAVGVIGGQRAWTGRSGVESLWSARVGGVRRGLEASRGWRDEGGDEYGGGLGQGGLEGVREEQ